MCVGVFVYVHQQSKEYIKETFSMIIEIVSFKFVYIKSSLLYLSPAT